MQTRRPVVIPDATTSDLVPRSWLEAFGVKATVAVPLIRQDEVIGVMILDHMDRPVNIEPWQVDLAMAVAGQLALP